LSHLGRKFSKRVGEEKSRIGWFRKQGNTG
jgi:hypothetical protein